MSSWIFWCSFGALGGIVFSSFFEWILHRYFMHRPMGKFDYPYRTHALIHHKLFKADHTYHLQDEAHRSIVTMAWWNGPVLVLLCQVPFIVFAAISGKWACQIGALLSCSVYYCAYEYLHYCMHVPKTRRLERSGIFFRLNGHHLLHHRYMSKNYNTVLPLADICLGTMMLRSRLAFAQAQGPSLPNVQPRLPRIASA